jgi:hypothetical protein
MDTNRPGRRRFLARMLAAAAALPLLSAGTRDAFAQALKPLDPTLANAKALKYSPDATKVGDPARKPGSQCANCQFFQAGTGACQIFPGYSVKPTGWCAAWAKKA